MLEYNYKTDKLTRKRFNARKSLFECAQNSNFWLHCVTILQDRVVMNWSWYQGFRERPLVINVNLLFMCTASLYVLKFSQLVVVSFMSVTIFFQCPKHSLRVFTHLRHWTANYQGTALQLIWTACMHIYHCVFWIFFRLTFMQKGVTISWFTTPGKQGWADHSAFIRKVCQAKSNFSAQVVLRLAVVAQELG